MFLKKIIKPLKRNKIIKAKNNLRLETLDAGDCIRDPSDWIQSNQLNWPSWLKIPTREFLSKSAQLIQAIDTQSKQLDIP